MATVQAYTQAETMTWDSERMPGDEPESASARLAAMMLPCPRCGKPLNMPETEAQEALDTAERLKTEAPGLYQAVHSIAYWCQRCINAEMDAQQTRAAADRLDKLHHTTYGSGLLPADARRYTVAGTPKSIRDRNPQEWALIERIPLHKSLWVYGDPGAGKTCYAYAIANAYLDAGHSVAHVVANALSGIRQWEAEERIQPYLRPRLLIIDDIDKPNWHPEGMDALWMLLDKRKAIGQRYIVTSNIERRGVQDMWRRLRPNNPTFARSLIERFLPMMAVHIEGKSIRVEQMNLAD